MKTMLNSKEFWSEGAYRAKVKSPFEMVASSARALDANVIDGWALANQVGNLGEPLYRKLEPTGYSNLNAEWVNSASLLGRMNFALQLAQNHVESVKVDVSRFGDDPSEVAKALMFRAMSPQTRAAIDKALQDKKQKKEPGAGCRSGNWVAGFPKEVIPSGFRMPSRRVFLKGSALAMFGVGSMPVWLSRSVLRRRFRRLAARRSWSPSSSAAPWTA
jgi:hypothetical protein